MEHQKEKHINECMHTKTIDMGNLDHISEYDRELFETFYDPDMEPLTKEEWREILSKYDDEHVDAEKSSMPDGLFEDHHNPCEEYFTNEEWAEILERFGSTPIEGDKVDIDGIHDDEQFIKEMEIKYGVISVENNLKSTTDEKRKRTRARLPRRGGRSNKHSKGTANITILHSNCDGYTSKKESIEEIVKERGADILLLNETALKGKRKVKIKDYFSFTKNREKIKGGVATIVANYIKPYTVKVTEGQEEDEYIITRFDHVVPALNVVNIYGHQESRTSKDEILASWLRLQKDLEEIDDRGEAFLLLGDLNRAVGSDEWGITGNHSKVSYGGQHIRDIVKEKDYVILNNMAV